MDHLQRRCFETFQRVNIFGVQFNPLFPQGSLGRQALDDLAAGIQELRRVSPSQTDHKREARNRTDGKALARKHLRAGLRRIIRTARFIAGSIPGFDEPFKLPRSESDAALLYTARQFAERATAAADIFVRFSMPATFIEELNTHIRDIEQAVDNRAAIWNRQKEATAAIDAAVRKCMKALLDLDVIVANTIHDMPTLTAWKSARHVTRPARKKKVLSGAGLSATQGDAEK